MPGTYSREERNALERALKQGAELRCPACGSAMLRQDVVPPQNVPYVRHRAWLICTGCKKSASLDT